MFLSDPVRPKRIPGIERLVAKVVLGTLPWTGVVSKIQWRLSWTLSSQTSYPLFPLCVLSTCHPFFPVLNPTAAILVPHFFKRFSGVLHGKEEGIFRSTHYDSLVCLSLWSLLHTRTNWFVSVGGREVLILRFGVLHRWCRTPTGVVLLRSVRHSSLGSSRVKTEKSVWGHRCPVRGLELRLSRS